VDRNAEVWWLFHREPIARIRVLKPWTSRHLLPILQPLELHEVQRRTCLGTADGPFRPRPSSACLRSHFLFAMIDNARDQKVNNQVVASDSSSFFLSSSYRKLNHPEPTKFDSPSTVYHVRGVVLAGKKRSILLLKSNSQAAQ
jgi:hypothetical protein